MIFKSPMKFNLNNLMNVGTFYCDSYMNYILSKSCYISFKKFKNNF